MQEQGTVIDQAVTLCEGVLQRCGIDRYLGYIGLSVTKLAHGLVFFGGAFVVGFCFKRYFKLLFAAIFVSVVAYLVLHYNNLIQVDWLSIKEWLGVPLQNSGIGAIWQVAWAWIQQHLFVSITGLLGFLFGYKLG